MARKGKKVLARAGREAQREVKSSQALIRDVNPQLLSAIVLSVFVLFFPLLAVTSFLEKSPTVDEPVHLLAGYSYLKWGDFRANPEHPPLAKIWAALPLLTLDIKDPRSSLHWDLIPTDSPRALHTVNVAARLLFSDNDADTLFFYAKPQMIGLGILLGIFVFLWSKRLFGLEAAIVSLFIYCLDPNILAHSQLVHTDIAFTTFFFISTYFFWRALGQLTWLNLFLTALFFGFAAITKYAYFAILLVWGILCLLKIFSPHPQECSIGNLRSVSSRWGKAVILTGVLMCALVTAYLFIWAAYGFRFHAIPGGGQYLPIEQEMPQKPLLQALVSLIVQFKLFPEAWIYGQLHVFNNLDRDAYLLGEFSDSGFWLYFPVAFAVKTPLPTLFLLIGTIGIWIYKWRERPAGLFLLIPVAVYFSLAVLSRMNIGLRHILPIYPFLFLLLGGTAAKLWKAKTWVQRGSLIFLGLWYVWSSVSIHPHYLAFFNEIVGGPKNGHKVLIDSNLDWGQDLKGLKRWMDEKEVKRIQFLYFGFYNIAAPQYYGIDALYLPGSWIGHYSPVSKNLAKPNYLAISVNHLYGPFLNEGQKEFVRPIKSLEPIATVGHTIFVYRLDKAIERYRWIVQMDPTSEEAHVNLANLLDNQGRIEEAIQHYEQAIEINPASAEAHNNLAVSLAERGGHEKAIEHFRKAAEINPRRVEPHFYLGTSLARQGYLKEAVEHFRKALEIKPGFVGAHHYLGIVMAAQGDLGKAIDHFRQALRIQPEFAEAHESLGRALAQRGSREEAAKHYQEALRIMKSHRQQAEGNRQ